jgi:hypothetical protein
LLSFHAQNGIAERKHCHVIETARTFLISSFVPSHFWSEAIFTAVYLINRQPSSNLSGKCPGEVLFGTLSLRIFGCTCYFLLSPREQTKLTAQFVECVFWDIGLNIKAISVMILLPIAFTFHGMPVL